MATLLVLTVGGSCAPVITAIRDYQPDFVCFFGSSGEKGSRKTIDGPGNPCGDARKAKCPECGAAVPLGDPKGANILIQTGLLEGRYDIVELPEPDDLPDCYKRMQEALTRLRKERADWRFLADYTGGTKTMSAALALAALEANYELSLVKGARADLVKVRNGTEIAGLVNAGEVRARQHMAEAQHLYNAYAYASAGEILQSSLRAAPLSAGLQQEIREQITLCRGFDAWDRFDHARASSLLEPYQARIVPQWRFLKQLTGREPGYAPVLDLLLNAERRATRSRCDDAVARLYRALELLAQIRLKQRDPALESGNLDVSLLPEGLQSAYEGVRDPDGKIKLALRQDYELLAALQDPLGEVYRAFENRLLQALSHRNYSILAHGQIPIDQATWQEMYQTVKRFIESGLQALKVRLDAPQFPQWK